MLRVGTLVWRRRCRGGWLGCEEGAFRVRLGSGGFWVFWEFLGVFRAGCEVLVGMCVSELLCLKGQYMGIQGVDVLRWDTSEV
jgi:hypothetical protein